MSDFEGLALVVRGSFRNVTSWIPACFRVFNASSSTWQTRYINAVRGLVVVASQPHGRFPEVMGTGACAGGCPQKEDPVK